MRIKMLKEVSFFIEDYEGEESTQIKWKEGCEISCEECHFEESMSGNQWVFLDVNLKKVLEENPDRCEVILHTDLAQEEFEDCSYMDVIYVDCEKDEMGKMFMILEL